ncbi:MAG: APC family permease, partial [Acidobacteriaceae bacterium]|nr:APC family permease [Acidobacteriaceae bacterium]
YGPEAALTLLIPLGLAGLNYVVPIIFCIIVLLIIVFFSYRQTIEAYPGGGGSYTVARENLGTFPGLLAASALLIDYVLTAAVGISAGIGALTSAVPSLHPRTLSLCLLALLLLTLVNLRGVRETGGIFMIPTYLFLGCMLITIGIGVFKAIASGGHPAPVIAPPVPRAALEAVSIWLLLKAFSSGCTAMTGVEAVSNGVRAFRDTKAAQQTLALIIAFLVIMLGGIAFLAKEYKVTATDPNGSDYQSLLSMLLTAVTGRGTFYYIAITSILLVLIFSANTAFADFPRVCRFLAEDRFMPLSLANRGRRLVYNEGIVALSLLTAALLLVFKGVTDRLIPLYAVGAFLAFTLSQAGMVAHWKRQGGGTRSMFVNGLGAVATGITVLVVVVAKFAEGAWITVVAIPAILLFMHRVHRHYERVAVEIGSNTPLETDDLKHPLVVIPLQQWSKIATSALRTALTLSDEIKVLHVAEEGHTQEVCTRFQEYVERPTENAHLPKPELVMLQSPYRFVVGPIVDYVVRLAEENPDRRVITIVPELIENKWYNYFLHSQRATLLKTNLLMKGNDRISVLNIPCYLKGQ